jgi:hypothetical protein
MKPEQIIQCQLMDWVRSKPEIEPYIFHVANERQTSPQHGRLLKRMGVRAGVSDVFVGIPKGEWHGMWLELKAPNGKLSKHQERFMQDMASQGYYCVWVIGFEAARQAILKYLALETPSL